MSSRSADLLDINVWIALSVEEHDLHSRALRYFREKAANRLAFCRTTALGLVRVSMNKNAFGGIPLSLDEAWQTYQGWRGHPTVEFLPEARGIEYLLNEWIASGIVPTRLWTDAYLAAFAISAELRLVSFDKDFERFPGLDLLRL